MTKQWSDIRNSFFHCKAAASTFLIHSAISCQTLANRLPSIIQMASMVLTLPVVSVQSSFAEVLQEVQDGITPSDKFWVSCYKASEPSIHAKVLAELDEHDRNLVVLKPIEGDVHVSKEASGVSQAIPVFVILQAS